MSPHSESLRVSLAQINPIVGDFEGNLRKIGDAIVIAREAGCNLIALPEMALCGYPPEDLLLNHSFVRTNRRYIKKVAAQASGITVICGFVGSKGDSVFNSAVVAADGQLKTIYNKIALPNYGVFDEKRYFTPGREIPLLSIGSITAGVNICEDIWVCPGVTEHQAEMGASLIVNISASPYHMRRAEERTDLLRERARSNRCYVAYVNLVGGQDELVFDGASMVAAPSGRIIAAGKAFVEDHLIVDLAVELSRKSPEPKPKDPGNSIAGQQMAVKRVAITPSRLHAKPPDLKRRKAKKLSLEEEVYAALVLGTRDYILKNGFSSALVGLSGGIDSALTLAVAVDALGPEAVHSVFMPSQYTSKLSYSAAQNQADLLGCSMETVAINRIYDAFIDELETSCPDISSGITSENLQARIRGNILMAYSNRSGAIVLNTSNKSEAAVGYTTLYGDMVGGFAVLKDIPKTLVYDISRHLNKTRGRKLIAKKIITRPPTAELKADQVDSDSLPPYEILDEILRLHVELDTDESEIVKRGFDTKTVRQVIRMVRNAEYKRRQSPPGIKVTPRAFGRDRRWPITNRF